MLFCISSFLVRETSLFPGWVVYYLSVVRETSLFPGWVEFELSILKTKSRRCGHRDERMYVYVLFKQLGYFNFQFRKMVDYNTPKDVN